MSGSALVLSHLFPSSARPGTGPFVADQLEILADEHPITVVAPVRWVPPVPLSTWSAERRVPRLEGWRSAVDVLRPRVPAIPHGGLDLESRLLVRRLRPLVHRLARERDVRLIHAHFALPNGFAAAQLAREIGARLVLTVWGSDVLVFGRDPRLRPLIADALRSADHVIAVSDELAERSTELGARDVVTAPGGVPMRFAAGPSHEEAREELGLAADERWILWAGGLVPVKQPRHAVEAFARVAREVEGARLALIGDGPLRGDVERLVAERGLTGRVRLLGHRSREDVATWQAAADVLCNSSASEGTPLAVLEALVKGTPVAAYDVGGIAAALRATNGGRIVSERTPQALGDAITAELVRPRGRAVVAASARPLLVDRAIEPVRRLYEQALHA